MGNQIVKKTEILNQVATKLDEEFKEHIKALPAGLNRDRFIQNALTVLRDTKNIENCSPASIKRTILKGALLDLDFSLNYAYAIPYGGELQFQASYIGMIKLAKKYSPNPIQDIYAKIVKEGDVLDISVVDGKQSLNFSPKPINDGQIVGVFAVVLFQDESMHYDVMTKKEIEFTRTAFSKCSTSKAWKDSFGEMAKKTVLRRLCKLISLDFESPEQAEAFKDSSDFDVNKQPEIIDLKVVDPFEAEQLQIEEKKEDLFNKNPSDVKCDAEGRIIE